jgi:hypothetical protein
VVTNQQLYVAVGIPLLFNASLIGILIAYVNAKFQAAESKSEARFAGIEARFAGIEARFTGMDAGFRAIEARLDAIDKRFDDMRDLWRAELRRVEEVIDARLKHLEERG